MCMHMLALEWLYLGLGCWASRLASPVTSGFFLLLHAVLAASSVTMIIYMLIKIAVRDVTLPSALFGLRWRHQSGGHIHKNSCAGPCISPCGHIEVVVVSTAPDTCRTHRQVQQQWSSMHVMGIAVCMHGIGGQPSATRHTYQRLLL
jgi:hypothetical protein